MYSLLPTTHLNYIPPQNALKCYYYSPSASPIIFYILSILCADDIQLIIKLIFIKNCKGNLNDFLTDLQSSVPGCY